MNINVVETVMTLQALTVSCADDAYTIARLIVHLYEDGIPIKVTDRLNGGIWTVVGKVEEDYVVTRNGELGWAHKTGEGIVHTNNVGIKLDFGPMP